MKLTINNNEVITREGATILQAARENGIYIPTLCFLSKLSPAASCRFCVVEVEGMEGLALSCNTLAREGIKVTTNSPKIQKTREAIAAMMCVNHPLQCGVCDKSGACELQDKAVEFRIKEQIFSAKEQPRRVENWSFLTYDPSLCVLCERCVKSCNEIVGSNALTIASGGYKSKISYNLSRCVKCGECAAVCPVGAIVTNEFKYRANAWELSKTPSTCLRCSIGCDITIETKRKEILRIAGDVENGALCGMGRFNYETAQNGDRDRGGDFAEKLKTAKSVLLQGDETNEEAFLLQKLSDRLGFTIVNNKIARFGAFLKAYGEASGEKLWNIAIDDVARADKIWIFAPSLCDEAPLIRGKIAAANIQNRAETIFFTPIEDSRFSRHLTRIVRYETGAEEGVFALLLRAAATHASGALAEWIDALDAGNISAESSAGEEEFKDLTISKKTAIIIGSEIYTHKRAENIAVIVGILRRLGVNVLMIPPTPNALGILLSASVQAGKAEIAAPSVPFEAKEGTILTIDRGLKKLHAAISCDQSTIAKAAKTLGERLKWAIDLTPKLPFNSDKFDDLTHRSIAIEKTKITIEKPQDIKPIGEYNGAVAHFIYAKAPFSTQPRLVGSAQFAAANKIANGGEFVVETNRGTILRKFVISQTMKGTIARLEAYDLDAFLKDADGYSFEVVKLSGGRQNG